MITVTVTFSEAFDGSVRILDNSLPVPLLFGTNPGDRRHARLMANYGDYSDFSFTGTDEGHPSFLRFTYTVQPDDNLDDDDATATLSFGTLPSTVKEGGDHQTATVTIRDNDAPEVDVELGADAYSANEGGTATVAVTLSADPERTVTIPLIKTEQGGISTADYSGVPASVTFNAGETSKTLTFSATQDDMDDGESMKLAFGSLSSRVTKGATDETTLSFAADDDPRVTAQFTEMEYTVVEGSNAGVRVTLGAEPERTVSIPVTTANQGGATAADYTVPSSVTFDSGETEKTITFAATDDDVEDFGESVKLGFGTPLPDRITKSGTQETTINIWQLTTLDCSADLKLADRTSYDWAW